jgi:hypothetical protein
MASPTLYPAHDVRAPLPFLSIDALAAHLIRQRPGRAIELTDGVASLDGAPMQPVLSAYAIPPRDRRAFMDDPAAFEACWLGLTMGGPAGSWSAMTEALARVRSAGGLAA